MTNLVTGLLSVLLATNQAEAASNLVKQSTGIAVEFVNPNDPVEHELQKIMAEDDKAHEEIDKWIRDGQAFDEKGAGSPLVTLNARIERRQNEVKKLYADFLEKHPKHARGLLAYGSFLNDSKDEHGAAQQWEKSRELDPSNPAVWNNLANYYGHVSPVKKSFDYYARAIELNPREPLYLWNLATTIYLFRPDAMEHYKLTETEVFDKALALYRGAIKLSPTNFILLSDYANSFYGTKPPRYNEGIRAWEDAYKAAGDDIEREGVLIHLARCKINLGRFDAAKKDLAGIVKTQMYLDLKQKLEQKIANAQTGDNTNAVPAAVGEKKETQK